jgi:hypothetical protein
MKPNVGATIRRKRAPSATTWGSSLNSRMMSGARAKMSTPRTERTTKLIRAARWLAAAARSGLPAPMFWPVIVSTPRSTAMAGMKMSEKTRMPTPKAASTATEKTATTTSKRLTETARPVPSMDAGTPRRSSRGTNERSGTMFRGLISSPRVPRSMIAMPTSIARPRAKTVAMAAPWTPRAGKGPHPKMRKGSRATFRATVPNMTSMGVTVSPAPRMSAMNTKKPNMNGRPSAMASMYAVAWSRTAPVAPSSATTSRT